jgi:hypothetical protein
MARRFSLPPGTWRDMGEKLATCARPSTVLLRSRTSIGIFLSAAYASVKSGLSSVVDCRERLEHALDYLSTRQEARQLADVS